jgi:hypothetical protein
MQAFLDPALLSVLYGMYIWKLINDWLILSYTIYNSYLKIYLLNAYLGDKFLLQKLPKD